MRKVERGGECGMQLTASSPTSSPTGGFDGIDIQSIICGYNYHFVNIGIVPLLTVQPIIPRLTLVVDPLKPFTQPRADRLSSEQPERNDDDW